MLIFIKELSEFSGAIISVYLKQMATWHWESWGAIVNKTQDDFLISMQQSFSSGRSRFFIAIDADKNNTLVGCVTLKKENMRDEYPTQPWGPWISGLYIRKEYRMKKIAILLGIAVINAVKAQGTKKLFYFSHNHALKKAYSKVGVEMITPEGKQYSYRKKPIILFSLDVDTALAKLKRVADR